MMNYEKRYDNLRKYMAEAGLDGIYINSPENFYYMSGYSNPDGYMLITRSSAYAFSDFRYIEAAREKTTDLCKVCLIGEEFLVSYIEKENIKTLGIEDCAITVAEHERLLSDLPNFCKTVPVGTYFTELRAVKESFEVDQIKAAQRIAETAFDKLLNAIRPNMTEIEVASELEYYMKKGGSDKPSFDTIAVSGKASSVPHGTPRNVPLERGFLTLDFGATVGGYCSDMTRTVVIGHADDDMRNLYNTVLTAQTAAIEAITCGADCGEMDRIARDIINGAGYEGKFGHSLGHGVGIMIHELPVQSPRAFGKKLEAGNIVTVEPGIYIEGMYGCRIEDMMYITESGAVNLTDCTKELIEIV
ncbi:MAG: aminopeptidase P family protein [Clostridiales bacterium]|nr:aminopeptidase P family protein [Clostridiales bacterium]